MAFILGSSTGASRHSDQEGIQHSTLCGFHDPPNVHPDCNLGEWQASAQTGPPTACRRATPGRGEADHALQGVREEAHGDATLTIGGRQLSRTMWGWKTLSPLRRRKSSATSDRAGKHALQTLRREGPQAVAAGGEDECLHAMESVADAARDAR